MEQKFLAPRETRFQFTIKRRNRECFYQNWLHAGHKPISGKASIEASRHNRALKYSTCGGGLGCLMGELKHEKISILLTECVCRD